MLLSICNRHLQTCPHTCTQHTAHRPTEPANSKELQCKQGSSISKRRSPPLFPSHLWLRLLLPLQLLLLLQLLLSLLLLPQQLLLSQVLLLLQPLLLLLLLLVYLLPFRGWCCPILVLALMRKECSFVRLLLRVYMLTLLGWRCLVLLECPAPDILWLHVALPVWVVSAPKCQCQP